MREGSHIFHETEGRGKLSVLREGKIHLYPVRGGGYGWVRERERGRDSCERCHFITCFVADALRCNNSLTGRIDLVTIIYPSSPWGDNGPPFVSFHRDEVRPRSFVRQFVYLICSCVCNLPNLHLKSRKTH